MSRGPCPLKRHPHTVKDTPRTRRTLPHYDCICRFWTVPHRPSMDKPRAAERHIELYCRERCAVSVAVLVSVRAPERHVAYPLVRTFRVVGNLAPGLRASMAMA